jgi:hypothetical protein
MSGWMLCSTPAPSSIKSKHHTMGNKIVTEADRRATKPLPGAFVRSQGIGQKVSRVRGSHTNSKKNPGKRPHQGR